MFLFLRVEVAEAVMSRSVQQHQCVCVLIKSVQIIFNMPTLPHRQSVSNFFAIFQLLEFLEFSLRLFIHISICTGQGQLNKCTSVCPNIG